MRVFESIATFEPSIASVCRMVVGMAFVALSLGCVQAQTAPAKGSADTSSAATGFSIESEMLTYRALQANSEAIACDIAAYVNGTNADFKTHPEGEVCDVKAGSKKATVVVLPFDSSEFADFQIWRADMATMDRLQNKADSLGCPTKPGASSKGATTAASAASSALSLTPAGPPLAVAQGVLAMLAKEESTMSVGGTIHDQAFMDGVGRELEGLSVPVVMPSAYTPFSLTSLKESDSPFLSSLARTLTARGLLAALEAKEKAVTETTDGAKAYIIQRLISDIDAFLGTLNENDASAAKGGKSPGAKATGVVPPPPGTDAAGSPEPTQSPEVTSVPPWSSHLTAVLLADGLAAKLGVDPDTGTLSPEDSAALHILLVKALESGGSVTRYSNVLGTKVSYSGGSVGTYALFSVDGDLECSGNVYEYGGSIKGKDFEEQLRGYNPDPAKQMVFLRHSCRPLTHPQ
jgi:hypothetical protein